MVLQRVAFGVFLNVCNARRFILLDGNLYGTFGNVQQVGGGLA
jgi:hypothetical protein